MRLKNKRNRSIPDMTPDTRKVQLADGSTSNRILGSVSIRCKADNSDSKMLDFYVMDAPVNLLSRYAIEMLWPKLFTGIRAVVCRSAVKKVKNVTEVPEVVNKTKIQGRSMAPTHIKSTIFKYHGDTKKIHEERVVPVPKRGATSQYKCAPVKVPVKKINPVIKVKNCSDTVSRGVRASPEQELSGGCSSSSVRACESSDETGNTTALSEKLTPELPEMRTLHPLPEGKLTKAVSKARCRQICDLYPEVFNEQKGEFLGAEAEILIKDGHYDQIVKVGVRPPAKTPYGLEDQYNEKLLSYWKIVYQSMVRIL